MCPQLQQPSFILINGVSAIDITEKKDIFYMVTEKRDLIICLEMYTKSHFQNPTPMIPLVSAIDDAHACVLVGKPAFDMDSIALTKWLESNRRPFEKSIGFTIDSIKSPSLIEPDVFDEMAAFGLSGYAIYVMDAIRFFWQQAYIQTGR
jgi:hypothetical protein